jgi:hypothetical protein
MPDSRCLHLVIIMPVALGAIALTGCVNPSERIASSLTRYGLDQGQAQCVGDRLEANLSIGQLQQHRRAARAYNEGDTTPGRLTVADLIRVSSRIEDVKVPIEVGKAAAGCGVLTGGTPGL